MHINFNQTEINLFILIWIKVGEMLLQREKWSEMETIEKTDNHNYSELKTLIFLSWVIASHNLQNGCSTNMRLIVNHQKLPSSSNGYLKKKREHSTLIIEFEVRLMFEDLNSRFFRNGKTVKESARKRYCFY